MEVCEEAAKWLEKLGQDMFDGGIYHQDEFGTYSVHEDTQSKLDHAAELIRDHCVPYEDRCGWPCFCDCENA